MSAIHAAIEALQQERVGLETQLQRIDAALASLQGLTSMPDVPAVPKRMAAEKKAATPTSPRRARPAPAVDGSAEDRVLAALRAAPGPMKPKDLGATAGLRPDTLRATLKVLAKQKRVTVTGTSFSRRVALAGAPAKEAVHAG